MSPLFLAAVIFAPAMLCLVYFSLSTLQNWVAFRRAKAECLVSNASVLAWRLLNDGLRSVPFVRLVLEVRRGDGRTFVTETECFLTVRELLRLKHGTVLPVRYHPFDAVPVRLERTPLTVVKSNRTTAVRHHKPAPARLAV